MKSAVSKPVLDMKHLAQDLIKKLKQICDKNGQEVDRLKSASVLHQ